MKNEKNITVFSKGDCIECIATKQRLSLLGVAFDDVDVEASPAVIDHLKSQGFKNLPIVDAGAKGVWSGFRPEKINMLKP